MQLCYCSEMAQVTKNTMSYLNVEKNLIVCNKRQHQMFGRGTDYQTEGKTNAGLIVRSRHQLVKADCFLGWDVSRLPRSCSLNGERFFGTHLL